MMASRLMPKARTSAPGGSPVRQNAAPKKSAATAPGNASRVAAPPTGARANTRAAAQVQLNSKGTTLGVGPGLKGLSQGRAMRNIQPAFVNTQRAISDCVKGADIGAFPCPHDVR